MYHLIFDPSGYRCSRGHVFAAVDAVEREVSVLADSMYGRAATPIRQLELSCPTCGSEDLVDIAICDRCHQAAAVTGSDHCAHCDVIVEREEHAEHMRQASEARQRDLLTTIVDIARGRA